MGFGIARTGMLAASLLSGVSCISEVEGEGQDAVEVAPDTDKIQGGEIDGLRPAVGLLLFKNNTMCTGTLISPTHVLTAAHCTVAEAYGFYTGLGKPIGPNDYLAIDSMTEHAVASMVSHPNYVSGCGRNNNDIAIVTLAQPITDIVHIELHPTQPTVGTRCMAVGFGTHGYGETETYGQKRKALVNIDQVTPTAVEVSWGTGLFDHGDSGGPLLCGKKVAGVASCSAPSTGFYARTTLLTGLE